VESTKTSTAKAFTLYDVQSSLFDARRVDLFRRAVFDTVRPGDVVVDGGSGTGLLGMFAAVAGAERVYCVEINEEYVGIIEENARRNGLGDRIVAIHADAGSVVLPEKVDVIVCELLSAGFFYEPQLQAVGNLRAYLKEGGSIVPASVENYVDLIAAQERIYGLRFDYEPRWRQLDDDVALTETVRYLDTTFGLDHPYDISARALLRASRHGRANAVRISYRIHFTDTVESDEPTDFLLNPQVIFLPEPVPVEEHQSFDVVLSYGAGSNPIDCHVRIDRVS
jgi:predicted RNA methylase